MAIVEFHGALYTPYVPPFSSSTPTYLDSLMDASTEKVALILTMPRDGEIESFEYLKVADVFTGTTVKYSFQDLDSVGKPDGTADQYRTTALVGGSSTWTSTGVLSDDGTDTGVKRTVTRGQRIACVIEYSIYGSPDSMSVQYIDSSQYAHHNQPNAQWEGTGATWNVKPTAIPVVALKYSDGDYGFLAGCIPASSMTSPSTIDTSPSQELGMAISFPMPVRVGGVVIRMSAELSSAPTTIDVVLYDKDFYTVLDAVAVNYASIPARSYTTLFSTNWLFEGNEVYRIVLRVRDESQLGILWCYSVNSQSILNTVEGGQSFYFTARTGSSGTWVDTLTTRPWMSLLVTGLDHDTSGGSGGTGWEGVP